MRADGQVRGRFAPSPSGRMHLGNLYAAALAWLDARAHGGAMVLRIEDLDPERCREEYSRQLADDLLWLGLDWDEGYLRGGPDGPYRQSERTEIYAGAFEKLDGMGLVYPCYCTRAERLAVSAPHRSDGAAVYGGKCRDLTAAERAALERSGRHAAWRVRVPEGERTFTDGRLGPFTQDLTRDCGDFIVRRSDGVYAYQLAVVVDDAAMGITRVVRGSDLLDSTPRQLWLYETLGLDAPEFTHVPLLLAQDGRRLSKRDGDLDMGTLRRDFTAPELLGRLAALAGQLDRPECITAQELLSCYRADKLPGTDVTVPEGYFTKR